MSPISSLLSGLQPQTVARVEMTNVHKCTRFEERNTGRDWGWVREEAASGGRLCSPPTR